MTSHFSRRQFLQTTAAGAAATLAAPAIVTAQKSGSRVRLGTGDHQYEALHDWAKLPDKFTWQTTHNVAVDKAGNVYVIHEGHEDKPDHPSIFVFDKDGKYIKSFGNQFQGGGHGIEVRDEGGQEFLYVCAYQSKKTFAKLDLDGETVWQKFAPMESGVYAEGEATEPKKVWGRDRFLPTNFAFLDDGGFLLADGYGAFYIHKYDKDANWVSCFGGEGTTDGKFNTPHGIWIDNRPGREPSIVVCDRANARLQWFDMDGKHLETQPGYHLPANADTQGELLLIPDLVSRITLLDGKNNVIAQLGDDAAWADDVGKNKIREKPDLWADGKFIHPHDACFDHDGSIFVAEWVATGRISKLKKLV